MSVGQFARRSAAGSYDRRIGCADSAALTGSRVGRGPDCLFVGDGNDWIDARGGGFDVVGCGPGADAVQADRTDYVGVACERVTRR